jgi:hypothetical protein
MIIHANGLRISFCKLMQEDGVSGQMNSVPVIGWCYFTNRYCEHQCDIPAQIFFLHAERLPAV